MFLQLREKEYGAEAGLLRQRGQVVVYLCLPLVPGSVREEEGRILEEGEEVSW